MFRQASPDQIPRRNGAGASHSTVGLRAVGARFRGEASKSKSKLRHLFVVAALTAGSGPALGASEVVGQNFVPNVDLAFRQLARRPDGLAFRRGDSPEAGLCKHYQGLARWNAPDGTPYMFLTKSGNVPDAVLCEISVSQGHGYLIVARMGSRDKHGERLRSNLWQFDGLPPAADAVVASIALDGVTPNHDKPLPGYRHPGGMQIVDGVLAIGAENPVFASHARAAILFFDITTPEEPRYITTFALPDLDGPSNEEFGADPVGLTAIRSPSGACCRYLMIVAGGPANKEVRFYRSLPDPGTDATDLKSENLAWERVGFGTYTEAQLETPHCLGADWPTGLGPQHQMLNFVREGSLDGDLYLIGGRNATIHVPLTEKYIPFGDEMLDLYKVNLWADNGWEASAPGPCPFTHVNTRQVGEDDPLYDVRVANFAAAGGVYVSPSGELIIYNGKHDSDTNITVEPSPGFQVTLARQGVFFGEYRHFRMVREGSPTLRPSVALGEPLMVDEGSTGQLVAAGRPASTQAWIQLFRDTGARHTINGDWLPVDYPDRDVGNFAELDRLGLGNFVSFAERTSSWLWYAPPGCTISANDYPLRSEHWPGPDTLLLYGTGGVHEETNLGTLNFNDDLEGVTFFHRAGDFDVFDCDAYYSASIEVYWDMGGDGTFGTAGSPVTFSAAGLDGPDMVTVQVRPEHATDKSAQTGVGDAVPVRIRILNVPPIIASASLLDALGYDLDGGSSKAIVGLPVKLALTFTDPGTPDTQTATIDWGDGSPLDTSFETFSDAFGGATGVLMDRRVFTDPGSYTITATLTDDDGGATSKQFSLEVLSLEDALRDVVDQLNALIEQESDARILAALRAARDELTGNHGSTPPTNGALDKLAEEDPVTAITKIRASIANLIDAETRGAGDLRALKDMLGLVAQGIATGLHAKAQAHLPNPSPGQAKALATIASLILKGHEQLVGDQHLDACHSFRQAAEKALQLMK
jgi:hypothetical protein